MHCNNNYVVHIGWYGALWLELFSNWHGGYLAGKFYTGSTAHMQYFFTSRALLHSSSVRWIRVFIIHVHSYRIRSSRCMHASWMFAVNCLSELLWGRTSYTNFNTSQEDFETNEMWMYLCLRCHPMLLFALSPFLDLCYWQALSVP